MTGDSEESLDEAVESFFRGTVHYSVALRIKSGFVGGKTRFPVPYILRIQAHSLPFFVREDQALVREETHSSSTQENAVAE